MKNQIKKNTLILAILIGVVTSLSFCTKHDQVIDQNAPAVVTPPPANTSVLTSVKTTLAPTFIEQLQPGIWDGSDAAWSNAPKLTVTAIVPDATMLSSNNFLGFLGNSSTVTMRSMYDASNVYFMAEWTCTPNVQSAFWYYDPATKAWAQEVTKLSADANGVKTRDGFTQDKFAMIFNVDNSCYAYNSQGCYGVCHLDVPNATGVLQSYMRTNGPIEKLDLWWADMIMAANYNQASDGYEDYAAGVLFADGRHTDAQLATTPLAFSNKSTKKTKILYSSTGTSKDTNALLPLWAIPTSLAIANSNAMFLSDTVSGGKAQRVMAIDTSGVLYLQNGSTINPTADYQRSGPGVGQYCIPGSFFAPFQGSRADITCNVKSTATGWKMIMKRALNTTDLIKQDVMFKNTAGELPDQPFGIGLFFNHANNQHAIVSGLTLKFQK